MYIYAIYFNLLLGTGSERTPAALLTAGGRCKIQPWLQLIFTIFTQE